MSARTTAVYPNPNYYADFERHLTTNVIAESKKVSPTDFRKKVACEIHKITIENWARGVFTIGFAGRGADRYHCLSSASRRELGKLNGRVVQSVLAQIAEEIVSLIGEKAQILRLGPVFSDRLANQLKNPQPALKEALSACPINRMFPLQNGCVLVFKGIPTPSQKENILRELLEPGHFPMWKTSELLHEFSLLISYFVEDNKIYLSPQEGQHKRVRELHRILHAQFQDPASRVEELAQYSYRDLSFSISGQKVMLASHLIEKLKSHDFCDCISD